MQLSRSLEVIYKKKQFFEEELSRCISLLTLLDLEPDPD
jgi:hypothetical protein